MGNKTTMSIRDFVIIYNLVKAELNHIRNMLWAESRSLCSSIVEEELKNDIRYQELLSIINRLDSMSIDVNVPDIEIENKTDNLTN